MKFQPHVQLAMVFALVIASAGCQPPLVANVGNAEPSQGAGGPSVEVVTAAKPTRKTLEFVSTQPARIEALDETPLFSKLSGYVAEVLVDLGDAVEKGQPLVRLGVPEMEVELLQRQALVELSLAETEQAQAAVKAAEAAVASAEAQVAQAEAGIGRTKADQDRWRSELARIEQLAQSGAVNRQLADETKQKFAVAEAARQEADSVVLSAKALTTQAQAGVEKAKADVDAAKVRERVAQANLQYAKTMLAYADIKAPYAGVITARRVDPGHYVQPAGGSGQPLLVVARTDIVRIFAAVPEVEAPLVDLGDAVTIEVQYLGGAPITGKVARTPWSLDRSNRALEAIIDVDNKDGRLRPGMYATARISLAERKDVITLPPAAVVREGRKAFCFLAQEGKAVKHPIQLGLRVGDDFEIASGLSGDETVILNKASALKDSQPIEARPPEPKK